MATQDSKDDLACPNLGASEPPLVPRDEVRGHTERILLRFSKDLQPPSGDVSLMMSYRQITV